MDFDVVIHAGTVVDGTGTTPAFTADIGVRADRIGALGAPGSLRGVHTIDARGRLVTPGFFDIHTHYDAQVLWDPALGPSCHQGVTTVVGGNCGFTLAPCRPEHRDIVVDTLESVEDMSGDTLRAGIDWSFTDLDGYLAALERRGVGLNYASYVGHTALRLWAMGDDAHEREATAAELATMVALARDALAAGAVGVSTDRSRFHRGAGGRRVPSAVASRDEIEALLEVTAAHDAVFEANPDDEFAWLYEAALRTGATVTWTALVTYPEGTTGRTHWRDKRQVHRDGRARGAKVHPQVTCRPLTVQLGMHNPTPFIGAPAFRELLARPVADRPALYADRAWRERARDELASGTYHHVRWDAISVAETTQHGLVGRSLASLAADDGRDPFDVLVDIAATDGFTTRCTMVVGNDDADAVGSLLREEGCVLGISDAGAHVGMLCDAGMPVEYLAHWVRDRGIDRIEQGVHRLTGEPAALFGVHDRGVLEVGRRADLVVLDLDALAPSPLRRVADLPAGGDRLVADDVRGIEHVLVNGTPLGTAGGRVLRRGAHATAAG